MYPNDSVEVPHVDNVKSLTYRSLVGLNKEDIIKEHSNYDLIIMDECHRCGADLTLPAMKYLISQNSSAHLVALTATPNRPNGVDVVAELLGGITVYPYTLWDAFNDGILLKPYYEYYTYDVRGSLRSIAEEKGIFLTEFQLEQLIKEGTVKRKVIKNMDEVIKRACNKVYPNTKYMKFIAFYSRIDDIKTKGKELEEAFAKAYPEFKIRSIEVHSRDDESADLSRLKDLTYTENTIDIIHSRDMLNMGYHVDDVSGIVFFRATSSPIVFIQQLGRAISVMDSMPKLVLDFVDNIHRKSLKNALTCKSKESLLKLRKQLKDLLATRKTAEYNGNKAVVNRVNRSIKAIDSKLTALEKEVAKERSKLNNDLYKEGDPWYKSATYLDGDCFNAISNEAEDIDYFEKLVLDVARPECGKSVKAWVSYIQRLSPERNSETPLKVILNTHGYTEESILETDAAYLKNESLTAIPLRPYCEIEGVSFQSVLNYMKELDLI